MQSEVLPRISELAEQLRLDNNDSMTTATALHQLFDSVGNCLSLEAASKLQELRITDELQSQLDVWASKNSEGVLEADERQQYEAIQRALNFAYQVIGAICSKVQI